MFKKNTNEKMFRLVKYIFFFQLISKRATAVVLSQLFKNKNW